MGVIIGAKHEETKQNLRDRVRNSEIKVIEGDPDKEYTCFFCNTRIEGRAVMLVDETPFHGYESEKRFSSCTKCYESAQKMAYYQGIPSSLS